MNEAIDHIMWMVNNLTTEEIKILREVGENIKDYKTKKDESKQRPETSVPPVSGEN